MSGYKTRGDQFVTVVVETPTKLTKEQKELLRKLESVPATTPSPSARAFLKSSKKIWNKQSMDDPTP